MQTLQALLALQVQRWGTVTSGAPRAKPLKFQAPQFCLRDVPSQPRKRRPICPVLLRVPSSRGAKLRASRLDVHENKRLFLPRVPSSQQTGPLPTSPNTKTSCRGQAGCAPGATGTRRQLALTWDACHICRLVRERVLIVLVSRERLKETSRSVSIIREAARGLLSPPPAPLQSRPVTLSFHTILRIIWTHMFPSRAGGSFPPALHLGLAGTAPSGVSCVWCQGVGATTHWEKPRWEPQTHRALAT